jgi:hypothetical protein
MTYEQKHQELDRRIRSAQKLEPLGCYITDGIVDIDQWRKQAIRPLFIGKEAYEQGDRTEWSASEELKNNPREACRASPRTWKTTAYVSYALQHGLTEYDKLPDIAEDEAVVKSLNSIAFINVGKCGAETQTPWERLDSLYRQNSKLLHDQIEFFQPNIVIGWSTLRLFQADASFTSRFGSNEAKSNQDAVDSWVSNGVLYVDAYHPVYFRVSQSRYVNSIVEAVKTHINAIDKSLPKL